MTDEWLTLRIAIFTALAAFFVQRIFYAEGTRRPLSYGPFGPISRPGRLMFCFTVIALCLHVVHLLGPTAIA